MRLGRYQFPLQILPFACEVLYFPNRRRCRRCPTATAERCSQQAVCLGITTIGPLNPHQAAGRRDQAGRPAALPVAAVAGIAAGRRRAGVSLPAVSVSVRGHRVSLSAAGGDPGRRDGAGQDDAGHHGHPALAPSRRGAQRAAGLPQAAGDQLAAGIPAVGAGGAGDGDRRRSGQTRTGSGDCPTCRCGSPTTNCCCAIGRCSKIARPCISIWSCSTNRSGSRTAQARRARSSARSRASAVGR